MVRVNDERHDKIIVRHAKRIIPPDIEPYIGSPVDTLGTSRMKIAGIVRPFHDFHLEVILSAKVVADEGLHSVLRTIAIICHVWEDFVFNLIAGYGEPWWRLVELAFNPCLRVHFGVEFGQRAE